MQNGGALLTGPAGVGKTVLVNMVKDLILAEDENAQIVVAALTHVAARLVQGSTIAHILHKHTTMTDGWFFLAVHVGRHFKVAVDGQPLYTSGRF